MSAPPIIEDTNRVAVVVSQVLGVLLVMITLLTQHGELQSWRPTGTKNQTVAPDDQNTDKSSRLWDDPLEGLLTFQVGASLISPSPSPSTSPTPTLLPSAAGQNQGSLAPSPEPTSTLTAAPSTSAHARIIVPAAQNQGKPAPLPSTSSTPTSPSAEVTPSQPGTKNQGSHARCVSVFVEHR